MSVGQCAEVSVLMRRRSRLKHQQHSVWVEFWSCCRRAVFPQHAQIALGSENLDIDAIFDLGQETFHGLDPFLGHAVRHDALSIKARLGPHGKLGSEFLVTSDLLQDAIPNWPSGGACAKGGEFLAIERLLLHQACAEIRQPRPISLVVCRRGSSFWLVDHDVPLTKSDYSFEADFKWGDSSIRY